MEYSLPQSVEEALSTLNSESNATVFAGATAIHRHGHPKDDPGTTRVATGIGRGAGTMAVSLPQEAPNQTQSSGRILGADGQGEHEGLVDPTGRQTAAIVTREQRDELEDPGSDIRRLDGTGNTAAW